MEELQTIIGYLVGAPIVLGFLLFLVTFMVMLAYIAVALPVNAVRFAFGWHKPEPEPEKPDKPEPPYVRSPGGGVYRRLTGEEARRELGGKAILTVGARPKRTP